MNPPLFSPRTSLLALAGALTLSPALHADTAAGDLLAHWRFEQIQPPAPLNIFARLPMPPQLLRGRFPVMLLLLGLASPGAVPASGQPASPAIRPLPAESYNPVFKRNAEGQQLFTADPAPLVVGDTLYVYAGRDEASIGGWFNMREWVCFSTRDMVTWTYEGAVMKAADFSWGTPNTAWACQVVARHGKFFLYSTTGQPNRRGLTIGVAVSDRPTGPFVDALGRPLLDNTITTDGPVDGMEDIDPTVFIDGDGQAYLYWGNRTLHYALLNDDMVSLKDLNGDGRLEEGVDVFSSVPIEQLQGIYSEAPWVYKWQGIYYLVYAGDFPQKVRYATAASPRGPWRYAGTILGTNVRPDGSRGDHACDTSHPGIVEFNGESFLFYHNSALPTGGQTRRSVCVERIHYAADGTILPATITSTGPSTGPFGGAIHLVSARDPGLAVTHAGFDVTAAALPADPLAFRWELLAGLVEDSAPGLVSIQSAGHPGYFLSVEEDRVLLAKNDSSADFARRATFSLIRSAEAPDRVQIRSLQDSSRYLRLPATPGGLQLSLADLAGNAAEAAAATFQIVPVNPATSAPSRTP